MERQPYANEEQCVSNINHYCAYKPGRVQPPPVPELIENELEYEVESVLAHRDVCVRRKRNRVRTPVLQRQYVIKWKGYDESNNTWEPDRNCSNCQNKIDEYFARIQAGAGTNKQKRTANGGLHVVRSSKRTFRGWCVILVYDLCAHCPRGIIYTLQTHRV
jgi:hypothetical protein